MGTQNRKNDFEVTFKDFEFVRMLGAGAYGGVYLVRRIGTEDLFAMKVIDCAGKVNLDNKKIVSLSN